MQTKTGLFKVADGGTLFLDEVSNISLTTQAKLLRVLQEREVVPIGGTKPEPIDIRLIAATNRGLKELVAEGRFREDLFFRLNIIPIDMPPLRDRQGDLPTLVGYFLQKFASEMGKEIRGLSPGAMALLERYSFPGNVRELENTLEQLFVLASGPIITLDDLPDKLRVREAQPGNFVLPPGGLVLEDLEQDLIRQAMERSGGRIKDAAELLGLTYKTLQYRLKKHEIERD